MKYLKDYTQKPINNLLKEQGGFFAFSDKQFKESRVKGVEYVSLYSGLIAPKKNAKTIYDGMKEITKQGIKQDMKENTIKKIVFRECQNYELQFSYDMFNELKEILADYPIKESELKKYLKQFYDYCIKNDMF